MKIHAILSLFVSAAFVTVVSTLTQVDLKTVPLNWDKLRFGRVIESKGEYRITKIILDIPVNREQICFGPVKGLFQDDATAFKSHEITEESKLAVLARSFDSFFRLEQHGAVTSYGRPGKLVLVTNNGNIEIGITELGFTLGIASPSDQNTFYNWTLAKIIDDECRKQSGKGLKTKHFSVVSGQYWAESSKIQYEKSVAKGETAPGK